MSFAYPQAFFLLPIVVLFVLAALYNYKKKRKILYTFISNAAYKKLGIRSGGEIDFFKAFLATSFLVFFVLALAGPQWGEQAENVDIKGIELAFLLDTSNSMNAEDLKPNRLEVARQLINGVVDNLQTDYVSLINFAAVAYMQCPLTIDYGAFKMLVEASDISPAEEQGTDFARAFEVALKSFESSRSEKRLMILITDGEDQEGGWQELLPEIKKEKIVVFTVGVGIHTGAPIPLKNKDGEVTGWKKDKQGEIVMTRLDENTLIQIASQSGGQYFRLSDPAGVDVFVRELKSYERSVLKKKVKLKKKERFQYPLIIGTLLLFLEFIISEKRLIWKRES